MSFQWHPEVHERWGESRLQFWFLSYRTVYDRRAYVRSLEQLFDELGVCAYTLYELKGGYDLLVRAWLPHSVRSADLSDRLYALDNVTDAEPFKVQSVQRHWPWRDRENGGYRTVRPEAVHLDAGAQVLDLLALNGFNEQAIVSESAKPEVAKNTVSRAKVSKLFKEYEEAKLIVRPRYLRKGIKFVVMVSSQGRTPETLSIMSEEIAEILDKACKAGALNEASLYFGQGFESTRHLILARTPHKRYHDVNERLLNPINRLVAMTATRTRSYDMVAPEFASHRELLPLANIEPPGIPDDARVMLGEEESQTFEVKGAGLTSMDRWVKGDGRVVETKEAIARVGRAIVAMLNADGGVVLLGALEESKFPEPVDKNGRLAERADLRVGGFLAVGVDHEIEARGGWDPYILHLRRQLILRIGPNADFWIGPFEKRLVTLPKGGTRTLVAIPVRQPDSWFWLDGDEFRVRRGPESVRLDQSETQQWMRVTGPRGGWRTPGT